MLHKRDAGSIQENLMSCLELANFIALAALFGRTNWGVRQ